MTTSLFGRLSRLFNNKNKDQQELVKGKNLPSDDKLIDKIIIPGRQKYINLETGRQLNKSSASKKKYIDTKWMICSDQQQQFNRILKQLKVHKQKAPTQTIVVNIYTRKRKKIPGPIRHQLWMRDYGNISEARCCCCGVNLITETIADAGHIVAFSKGGSDRIDNLRLVCRQCNLNMGTENMNDFIKRNNYPLTRI